MLWRRRVAIVLSLIGLALCNSGELQAGLIINATYDSSITNDPNAATIQNTINAALQVYQNAFSTNITVNLNFRAVTTGLGSSLTSNGNTTYADYLANLRNVQASAADAAALALLPNGTTNPVNNDTQMNLATANFRAIGINQNPSPGDPDSTISLNLSQMNLSRESVDPNKYDLYSTAAHEINEALGMTSALTGNNGGPPPAGAVSGLDLYRYDQNGNRTYNLNANQQSYFSLDGTTQLARFNQTSTSGNPGDYGDFYSPGNQIPQVQDAFGNPGGAEILGNAELTALDVLGYNLTGNYLVNVSQTFNGTPFRIPASTLAVDGFNASTPANLQLLGNATTSGLTSMTIGLNNKGSLTVANGAKVANAGNVFLGYTAAATGTALISGTGSNWTTTGGLYIGGTQIAAAGRGNVTVTGGGALNVTGLTKVWQTGTLRVGNGGTLTTGTLSVVTGGSFVVDRGGRFNGAVQAVGTQTLNGNQTGNVQVQNGGTFNGAGTLTGNLDLQNGGQLGGTEVITGVVSGAGLVSPGNSPGILDVGQIDPSSGIDFLFQFTAANTMPNYLDRDFPLNDVLHITHPTAPFLSPLSNTDTVTVDFQVGALHNGDSFLGGFFTNQPTTDFYGDGTVSNALFYYLFNGSALDLSQWQVDATTIAQPGTDFGVDYGGVVDGRVMKFTLTAIPEPGSLTLVSIVCAGSGYYLRRRRRQEPSAETTA